MKNSFLKLNRYEKLAFLLILLLILIISYTQYSVNKNIEKQEVNQKQYKLIIFKDYENQDKNKYINNRLKININRAAKEDLVTISGIGEKTAENIIKFRLENGGINDLKELLDISGIGKKTYRILERNCFVEKLE